MSAPTDERTNEKKRKLRCTDLNMSETTKTKTGLPKNKTSN